MDDKAVLHHYLRRTREALLWKLEGLSERDLRLPRTPSGTNLLGLAKHVALVQAGYFGSVFGRPSPDEAWGDDDDPNADLYATASETPDDIRDLYARCAAHADATIETLELDAVGEVPWWPADRRHPTLLRVLVHVITDVSRHAGHADILREGIDGATGLQEGNDNIPAGYDWPGYVDSLTALADGVEAAGAGPREEGQ